jgi:hypothetical protein
LITYQSYCKKLSWCFFTEFCYNLRYVERNGRSWDDSWSLRQTTVYHRFDFKLKHSIWILLQSSSRIREWLEQNLNCMMKEISISNEDFMLLHVVFLSLLKKDWTDYLEDLLSEVNNLVRQDDLFICRKTKRC